MVSPPTFGCVRSGACRIFLCQGAHGGRGPGGVDRTFGPDGDEAADKGVWMAIRVDDVDAVHRDCVAQGLEVAWPPSSSGRPHSRSAWLGAGGVALASVLT